MTALLHSHKGLAYLLCLAIVICLVLVLTGARSKPGAAKALNLVNRFGVMMIGRVNLILGIAVLVVTETPVLSAWLIGSVLIWGVVEMAPRRLIGPEVKAVREGGKSGGGMVVGVMAQLLAIVAIFGLMTVRPG